MSEQRRSVWRRVGHNVRTRVVAGLIVLVPVGITFLVLRFLLRSTAGVLAPLVTRLLGQLPDAVVAAISVCALVVLLYLVGVLTTYLVGRRLIAFGESVVARIPLVKTVYSASKQVVQALSLPNRKSFKSVVWVEFPRPGLLALGFVTGTIQDSDGTRFYKVFIPTTPNPTTGFFELVPSQEAREADLTVEEAIKMIVSGGILSPDRLDGSYPNQPSPNESPPVPPTA